MTNNNNETNIFCKRLKEARLAVGLSQKKLGMAIGLDEFVASTRVNRYELGVHKVDLEMAKKFAEVLEVPLAYFYCEDDSLAELVRRFEMLGDKAKGEVMESLALIEVESLKAGMKKKKVKV